LHELVALVDAMVAKVPDGEDRRPMFTTVRNRKRPRTVRRTL
jgi:hypothetical protein